MFWTLFSCHCFARRVLSVTCPTSCPHAASMSSPRVCQCVWQKPVWFKILLNAWIRLLERPQGACGNGLNGIKLILQGKSLSRLTNWRACSSNKVSLTSLTSHIRWWRVFLWRGFRHIHKIWRRQSVLWVDIFIDGYQFVTRSSSLGACRLMASATSMSLASSYIFGTIPDVDRVTRRLDKPNQNHRASMTYWLAQAHNLTGFTHAPSSLHW